MLESDQHYWAIRLSASIFLHFFSDKNWTVPYISSFPIKLHHFQILQWWAETVNELSRANLLGSRPRNSCLLNVVANSDQKDPSLGFQRDFAELLGKPWFSPLKPYFFGWVSERNRAVVKVEEARGAAVRKPTAVRAGQFGRKMVTLPWWPWWPWDKMELAPESESFSWF